MNRHALGFLLGTSLIVTGCSGDGDSNTSDDSDGSSSESGEGSADGSSSTSTSGGEEETGEGGSSEGSTACAVTPPATWTAPSWDSNAATGLALRAQLDALTGDTMRAAEQGMAEVDDVAVLAAALDAGDPSLRDVLSPAFEPVVEDAFADFVALLAAGAQDLVDDEGNWVGGENGGLFGDSPRGINAGGIEVRQIVDKGLFAGAGLYNYAVSLTAGEIDEATIDDISAAWGANATLDPTGELADSAGYSHDMGFFAGISIALIEAKAYAVDPECAAERDEALRTAFALWEQAMFARMVYYSNLALGIVSSATMDAELADALHELAEGVGMAVGFRGLEDPASGPLSTGARRITDDQVAEIATALGVALDDLGASTTGNFVADVPTFEAAVEAMEAVVAEVYGLSAADIAGYREPTPG